MPDQQSGTRPDFLPSTGVMPSLEPEVALMGDVEMWNDLFYRQGPHGYTDDVSEALAWSAQFVGRPGDWIDNSLGSMGLENNE